MGSGVDRIRRFSLTGTGAYLPRTVVASDDLDRTHRREAGTSRRQFGIDSRHYAAPDETSSMMAVAAAEEALDDAGCAPDQLDAIIGACGVMEQPIPGTAPMVQQRLGLGSSGIPAYDINATCLSFVPALETALAGMALQGWNRVLIFASDIASCALDHDDPEASAIFGDGAAAILVETGDAHALLASRIETYGDHADLCRLDAGGTRLRPHEDLDGFLAASRFRMDGPALFRATARRFPAFLSRLLDRAGVTPADIGTVIPHQASAPALEHLRRALNIPADRVVDLFASLGNRIASSMPHALHVARRGGRLQPGSCSLLVGSSAGISLGGAVIRW
jgi:3-oxoacyl-[acyl-carrier-protein] synthase-3